MLKLPSVGLRFKLKFRSRPFLWSAFKWRTINQNVSPSREEVFSLFMTLIACPPVSTTNAHRLQINLIHQHRPSETKREAERRENGSSPALLGLRFYLPACLSVKFPPRAVASVDSPRSKLPERYQTHTNTHKHKQTSTHKHKYTNTLPATGGNCVLLFVFVHSDT